MKQYFTTSKLLASLFAAGVFVVSVPASAQMGSGMMGDKMGTSMTGSGAQQMSGLQHDMSGQMMGMSAEISKGNMSAAQQKQMGERMRMMGTMMGDMSSMTGQGMVMDAETQKRMEQMRMQMKGMMPGGSPGMK
ncbi:MAG: hypothetical protein ACYCZT_12305 [Thiobacillus sp.]